MQKTKDGCRWTIRLSNKDYAQKEVIRMFEYLLATGEYATESDIFREGIKSLYREKTEPDRITDWDNRIQKYTDEDIRNMNKITCKIAADYLGISPMAVSIGMRNNLLPIGFARLTGMIHL